MPIISPSSTTLSSSSQIVVSFFFFFLSSLLPFSSNNLCSAQNSFLSSLSLDIFLYFESSFASS
jgi:hypothetical protein